MKPDHVGRTVRALQENQPPKGAIIDVAEIVEVEWRDLPYGGAKVAKRIKVKWRGTEVWAAGLGMWVEEYSISATPTVNLVLVAVMEPRLWVLSYLFVDSTIDQIVDRYWSEEE